MWRRPSVRPSLRDLLTLIKQSVRVLFTFIGDLHRMFSSKLQFCENWLSDVRNGVKNICWSILTKFGTEDLHKMQFSNSEFLGCISDDKHALLNRHKMYYDRILYISPLLNEIQYNRCSLFFLNRELRWKIDAGKASRRKSNYIYWCTVK